MTTTRRAVLAAAAATLAAACSDTARRSLSAAPPSPSAAPAPSATGSTVTAGPSAAAAPPAGPAVEVDRATSGRPQVALTFHGAGSPATAMTLLAAAHRAGVSVTVLAVGTWLEAHPSVAREILAAGHELGNHTMTHPVLRRLDAAACTDEIVRCRDLLQAQTGRPAGLFRPSGGAGSTALIRRLAGAAGYPVLLGFDVDPRDYADPGADAIVSRTLATVRRGSIVSLHLGHAGTVQALPRLLDGLAVRGLTPVTADALLA